MNTVKIQKKFAHTAIYLFLLGAIFVGGTLSIFHLLQDDPFLIDVVLPPGMTMFTITCLAYLYFIPEKVYDIIRIFLLISAVALCLAAWSFSILAMVSKENTLIETFPPISPVFLAIIFAMVIFLDTYMAKKMVLITWVIFSTPILGYLAAHPQELLSIRGIELLVAIGPIMLMVFALVVIKEGIRNEIERLNTEKSGFKALSEQDPLTGLFNRRAGEDFLSNNINDTNLVFGLILFDIDHFKRINDEYGHDIGDTVLIEIVSRCKAHIRSHDLFMRWGGEEFLIVIKDVGIERTAQIAEKLRVAIATGEMYPGLIVTASFGVTEVNESDTVNVLLKRADTALYAAKQSGRNRVVTQA